MTGLAFPDPPLTDGVIALRPWRRDEDDVRYDAFTDPLIVAHSWPWSEPPTRERIARAFDVHERDRLAGHELNLAIADPDDGVLGSMCLYGLDREHASASIGYWLTPAARGRGHATRGLRLLGGWALSELGLARLQLTCDPRNEASQRVAERCGFVREGLLRSQYAWKDGRRDTLVYSVLPGELR
ncbi:MAG TPA: GNAT family N-acetyltransferase [Nocardioides sp.]|nr:GNAT family N-acetyltransferase [Nocardioides sp.]